MAGSSGSGDREYACSVPVYTNLLAMLSEDVDTLLEERWARQEEEYEWETEVVAAGAAELPLPDGVDYDYINAVALDDATRRQLALAIQLSSRLVRLAHLFESALRRIGDGLRNAVDPWRRPEHWPRRPHPGTAAWWHQRAQPGGLMRTRFVQVSWEDAARAGELVADAHDRALRLTALAEDVDRECFCGAASADDVVVHSTPQLLERLRRAQRLADDVLVPLHPLKRLLDQMSGADDEPRRRRGNGKRGRGRSASPPRGAAAASSRSIRRRSV